MKYWLYDGENITGPFSLADIQQMIDRGLLKEGDQICRNGETEWKESKELRELDFTRSTVSPLQTQQEILPAHAHYNTASNTFSATMPQMLKLAMRAIQDLGWKLDNANETLGLITFQTGMTFGSWSGAACSLTIEEAGENRFRVIGTGKQNLRGGQIIALDLFGEAKGKAAQAINRMKELAKSQDRAFAAANTFGPAANRFYVEKPGGEQQGPLEIADLQKLLKAGAIFVETPVFREGDEEWKTVSDFISRGGV